MKRIIKVCQEKTKVDQGEVSCLPKRKKVARQVKKFKKRT